MYYAYKYRLEPSDAHREELDRHRDICRQVYNHFRKRLGEYRENHGELPSMTTLRSELPDLKEWWDDLSDVYSRTLQVVVERLFDNLKGLSKLKENGYGVGQLKWKPPREYRSFTYSQCGFELDKKGGHAVLSLSKIGDIPIRLHRNIPDDAQLKQVTVKKEPTGKWFATFGVEVDREPPEKPDELTDVVGIDVGILKYAHDTDGHAVESLNLSDERKRLEREQRKLSRKQHGSANYERQRRRVAECYADLRRKRRDFLHKLSNYYAREYDLVAVEDLNVKGMMESPSNSRNTASAAWRTFLSLLEYKCEREGTHFVAVNPRGTTKECASCGVSTEKPLWVREHSCPACGFEVDRDANAAWNILSRGLQDVGMGYSESTPVETALPTGTTSVPAKRVVEAGSPTLKNRAASAASE
ncbi:IS200/IS605 family element transposase accessory protein TnpB (plasmid) [Halolamina sp. CBA1230]|uniref:Transposase, is605 orfb family n=1 Tax=Natrinema pellirubrum (strain DSM 15624 / CIP 106293 / JCM 10476 / NCIMB 786 / 157) TaxID=797303 RepID=L0JSB8_NATP1|nr:MULTISPECIES: RNA-guided endonuclease TnpB family protein [Halobacteria]AGB33718.1 transposase, IS605 OrfB family, central region [Natrinema pellirubrum DSM 15624]ELY76543.1 transposase, is605 orfb family [Natrinema pellirubrum DSM 15624]QKY22208.1 IS200/IS605 family element transposase accessory protein TnpB [Halolamina sp. CBA1230]